MQKQMNQFFKMGDPSSYKFSLEFDLNQTLLIYDGCFLTSVSYSDMDLIDGISS